MIQERLDEFIFHRTYLRDQPMNVWIMLRLLAKYGNKAYNFVNTYHVTSNEYYRAEEIEEDDEEKEAKEADDDDDQAWANREYVMNDDGNLVRLNENGFVEEVIYANPDDEPDDESQDEENGEDYEEDYDLNFNVNETDPELFNRLNNS